MTADNQTTKPTPGTYSWWLLWLAKQDEKYGR